MICGHSLDAPQIQFDMNIVFTALTLISMVILITVSPATVFPTMIEGVRNAIQLIIKLTAIYAVWLSVLKMMEATGLDKKLSNGLKPIIRRLFKGENDEAYQWISVNLASNMLGMGGASTPAGIKAMNAMCKEEGKATDNMLLLLVINATSIQIIPATVIALRATAGSENAASIFLPTLIATFLSTVISYVLCKLFSKHSPKDKYGSDKFGLSKTLKAGGIKQKTKSKNGKNSTLNKHSSKLNTLLSKLSAKKSLKEKHRSDIKNAGLSTSAKAGRDI